MSKAEALRSKITAALPGAQVEVVNFSDEHTGHVEAPAGGESHFSLTVHADCFAGLSLPERHRIIHRALGDLGRIGVHALKISTFAQKEEKRHS